MLRALSTLCLAVACRFITLSDSLSRRASRSPRDAQASAAAPLSQVPSPDSRCGGEQYREADQRANEMLRRIGAIGAIVIVDAAPVTGTPLWSQKPASEREWTPVELCAARDVAIDIKRGVDREVARRRAAAERLNLA